MIAKLLIIHFILHNSTDEKLNSEKLEDVDDLDDFKVNVQMFSRSPTPTNDNLSDSSINPMKGLQMAEFAFSDDDQSDDVLANNRLEDKLKSLTVSGKDVRSVVNDLSEAAEVLTEDEVEEVIEEDVIEDETAENTKNRSNSRNKDISERNHLSSSRSVSDAEIRTASKQEKNRTRSQQSYTADFSSESEVRTQSSPSHSYTGSEQNTSSSRTSKSSRSSRSSDSRSSRRSRSSRTSRSSRSSRSHERSRSKESSTDFSKSKVPLLFIH